MSISLEKNTELLLGGLGLIFWFMPWQAYNPFSFGFPVSVLVIENGFQMSGIAYLIALFQVAYIFFLLKENNNYQLIATALSLVVTIIILINIITNVFIGTKWGIYAFLVVNIFQIAYNIYSMWTRRQKA